MAVLPLPPPGPSPFLPPPPPLPVEPTDPLIDRTATAEPSEEWGIDEPTTERVNLAVLVAELHRSVSRAESFAHAAEALLSEVTLNSPAGPSRRARRVVDHLTSAREANLRALELVEALTAELAKSR